VGKFRNEKDSHIYFSPEIVIKKDEMGGACSTRVNMRHALKILIRKLEGKRTLGKPERTREDNIKVDL
jgi:hypothetical protein